jgi:hypothetical protein
VIGDRPRFNKVQGSTPLDGKILVDREDFCAVGNIGTLKIALGHGFSVGLWIIYFGSGMRFGDRHRIMSQTVSYKLYKKL